MPFIRIWIHLVWATKNRQKVLTKEILHDLLHHIRDNAKSKDIRLDFINGHVDHVHALVSFKADQSISKIAQLLKGESSHWFNQQKTSDRTFEWQDDYFAISICESEVDIVRGYIRNQETHHRVKSFAEEYAELLRQHGFNFLNEG